MGKFVISGGEKLSGKISVERAKNSVLPLLAASILTDEEIVIENCPKIVDVINMLKILSSLGVKTRFESDNLIINASSICAYDIQENLAKELRSSIFMMGALISRFKKAELSYPGGCEIGLRPIDIHINALKELGVEIRETGGYVICKSGIIKGKEIYLDFPSVGATENVLLASVLAEGKTEIHNAAKEPEIIDLMRFLNAMGAKVYGAGTSTILIDGVKKLHGAVFRPVGDRIEAGTYLIAAAITGGEIEINGIDAKNISSLIHKLCDNSCKITIKNDIIYLKYRGSRKSFSFSTGPYPFFPTDLQAQTTALLSVSEGVSVVTENVFEMRYKHIPELIKMGADITVKGRNAIIKGVERFNGASVTAYDLRGGAALVLAGLNAEGKTEVNDIKHIQRGYLDMAQKLRGLGANIIEE